MRALQQRRPRTHDRPVGRNVEVVAAPAPSFRLVLPVGLAHERNELPRTDLRMPARVVRGDELLRPELAEQVLEGEAERPRSDDVGASGHRPWFPQAPRRTSDRARAAPPLPRRCPSPLPPP